MRTLRGARSTSSRPRESIQRTPPCFTALYIGGICCVRRGTSSAPRARRDLGQCTLEARDYPPSRRACRSRREPDHAADTSDPTVRTARAWWRPARSAARRSPAGRACRDVRPAGANQPRARPPRRARSIPRLVDDQEAARARRFGLLALLRLLIGQLAQQRQVRSPASMGGRSEAERRHALERKLLCEPPAHEARSARESRFDRSICGPPSNSMRLQNTSALRKSGEGVHAQHVTIATRGSATSSRNTRAISARSSRTHARAGRDFTHPPSPASRLVFARPS